LHALITCSFGSLISVLHRPDIKTKFQTGLCLPPSLSQSSQYSFCRPKTTDFDLLQHWKSTTAATICNNQPSIQRMLQITIPALSTSCPLLGYGILAITCDHLAHQSSNGTPDAKLIAEGARHLSTALPKFSRALDTITDNNCNALFAFAIFVTIHGFVTASNEFEGLLSLRKSLNTGPHLTKSLASILVRFIRITRGIFFVFFRFRRIIMHGNMSPFAQLHGSPTLSEPQSSWILVEDQQLAKLELLWKTERSTHPNSSKALSDAMVHLRAAFSMVTRLTVLPDMNAASVGADFCEIHERLVSGILPDLPSAFTWQISISPEFIGMLEQQDPFVMVVLAHYAILLDRACSRSWWFRGLPPQIVATALLVLGDERRQWIEWPIVTVGLGTFDKSD
jgi:hypothetical protein